MNEQIIEIVKGKIVYTNGDGRSKWGEKGGIRVGAKRPLYPGRNYRGSLGGDF